MMNSRASALSLLVVASFVASSVAQAEGQPTTANSQPMTQGQPPMGSAPQGQPPMGSAPQGQPPMGQPMTAPANPPGKVDTGLCNKMEPKLRKIADACLKQKNPKNRTKCFDGMGKQFAGKLKACEAVFEPMKQEYMAKEKEMYPMQAPSMDGHNNQGQPPMGTPPGTPPAPPAHGKKHVDCKRVADEAKKAGDACLKLAKSDKRHVCWEKVGEKLKKTGAMEACGQDLEGLKGELQSKESQKYPTQEKAFQ